MALNPLSNRFDARQLTKGHFFPIECTMLEYTALDHLQSASRMALMDRVSSLASKTSVEAVKDVFPSNRAAQLGKSQSLGH
uniref:Uncharacterized protein n=1 Tax=Anguilla anguilla TaxID=7936 RepID=A0A0E9Q7I2_ANGAN